jgi:hypothetical protein
MGVGPADPGDHGANQLSRRHGDGCRLVLVKSLHDIATAVGRSRRRSHHVDEPDDFLERRYGIVVVDGDDSPRGGHRPGLRGTRSLTRSHPSDESAGWSGRQIVDSRPVQIVPLIPNASRRAASRVVEFIWPMCRPSTLPFEEMNTVVGKPKRR